MKRPGHRVGVAVLTPLIAVTKISVENHDSTMAIPAIVVRATVKLLMLTVIVKAQIATSEGCNGLRHWRRK